MADSCRGAEATIVLWGIGVLEICTRRLWQMSSQVKWVTAAAMINATAEGWVPYRDRFAAAAAPHLRIWRLEDA